MVYGFGVTPPRVCTEPAVAGLAVAAVQVQYYLHLCTKESTDWEAV